MQNIDFEEIYCKIIYYLERIIELYNINILSTNLISIENKIADKDKEQQHKIAKQELEKLVF